MSRVGWVVLVGILLAAGLFASIVSFGHAPVTPPAPPAAAPAVGHGLQMPVAGVTRTAIVDSWGDARSEGRSHHGTDIMAAGGTPVLAAVGGTIEKLFQSRLGGTTLYQRSADGKWTLYYAHLAGYAPGVHEGQKVLPGQLLGFVGDTGDAGPGNYHLHFSLTRRAPGDKWWQGEDVNAYPYLSRPTPLP